MVDQTELFLWGLKAAVCGLVFFLPLFVASWRRHQHTLPIGALNLLSPLSLVFPVYVFAILWCAALIWSLTPVRRRPDADAPLELTEEVLELTEEV